MRVVQVVGRADADVVDAVVDVAAAAFLEETIEPLDLGEERGLGEILVDDADAVVRIAGRDQPVPVSGSLRCRGATSPAAPTRAKLKAIAARRSARARRLATPPTDLDSEGARAGRQRRSRGGTGAGRRHLDTSWITLIGVGEELVDQGPAIRSARPKRHRTGKCGIERRAPDRSAAFVAGLQEDSDDVHDSSRFDRRPVRTRARGRRRPRAATGSTVTGTRGSSATRVRAIRNTVERCSTSNPSFV